MNTQGADEDADDYKKLNHERRRGFAGVTKSLAFCGLTKSAVTDMYILVFLGIRKSKRPG